MSHSLGVNDETIVPIRKMLLFRYKSDARELHGALEFQSRKFLKYDGQFNLTIPIV